MSDEQKQADVETVLKVPFVRGDVSENELKRLYEHAGYTPGRKEKAMERARSMVQSVFEVYRGLEEISGSRPTLDEDGHVNGGKSVFWENFFDNLDEFEGDAEDMLGAWGNILTIACEMYNEAKDPDSPAWTVEEVPVSEIEEIAW